MLAGPGGGRFAGAAWVGGGERGGAVIWYPRGRSFGLSFDLSFDLSFWRRPGFLRSPACREGARRGVECPAPAAMLVMSWRQYKSGSGKKGVCLAGRPP